MPGIKFYIMIRFLIKQITMKNMEIALLDAVLIVKK